MHELGVGHDGLGDGVGGREIGDHPLADLDGRIGADARDRVAVDGAGALVGDLVERGHVGAGDARQRREDLGARGARVAQAAVLGADLHQVLLALADEDGVDEGREGLGVVDRRAAREHERVVLAAVGGTQGDARQIEGLEHVGDGHLVRDVEPHRVEGGDRRRPLERQQRHARGAHGVGHVDPRHVAALAREALPGVQAGVEDGDALVGKADFVDVGVDEAGAVGRVGLGAGPPLVVDVAARLLDAAEQRLEVGEPVLVDGPHRAASAARAPASPAAALRTAAAAVPTAALTRL